MRGERIFVVAFVVLNVGVPPLVVDLYPFSIFPMFGSIAAGLLLISMHVGTTWLFGVQFWGNILLCAIFLVWIPWRGTNA